MKKIFLPLLVLFYSFSLYADVLQLKPNHPETYIVKRGDTLWDISGKFLKHPWKWAEIWEINPQVKNPHLIYPGDKLSLIYIDGKPRLTLNRGQSRGTVKLSPKTRKEPIIEPIPAVSLKQINSFLVNNRIFTTKDEFENSAYILAGKDEHLAGSIAGDIMYARGNFDPNSDGKYSLFALGRTYVDPDSKQVIGIDGDYVGTVETFDIKDDIAKVLITSTNRAVTAGMRLLEPEKDRDYKSNFILSEPAEDITDGRIIDVPHGARRAGANDVVVINKGLAHNIVEGNVLSIYKSGSLVNDRVSRQQVALPDEQVGYVMVFRVYDNVSYALVLESSTQVGTDYLVRNP